MSSYSISFGVLNCYGSFYQGAGDGHEGRRNNLCSSHLFAAKLPAPDEVKP